MQASIDFDGKVNAITLAYTAILGLRVHFTDIGAEKIDESILFIYGMVLAKFQFKNTQKKQEFSKKSICWQWKWY